VYTYCHRLIIEATDLLAKAWGTSTLVQDPDMVGYMRDVILPSRDPEAVKFVQQTLDQRHNIYIVYGKIALHDGTNVLYTRLSAQVYLEMSDYAQLASLVPALLQEYATTNSGKI
jgi:hypothetical protein